MTPPDSTTQRRRDPAQGAIRPAGVVAAMLTAAAVFVVGMAMLPSVAPPPPPIAPAPSPEPPPPPPPAPAPEPVLDAAGEAAVAMAKPVKEPPAPEEAPAPKEPTAAKEPPAPKQRAAPKEPPAPKVVPAPAAATAKARPDAGPPATTAAKVEPPASRDRSVEKDLAREAWRKNLPDVTSEPGKAAILIPIKGSIEGAVFHVSAKPRFVLVTLPKAEAMITMPFYAIKRDGFRQLWLSKDKDSGATTLKVNLGDASDPQVEIKDEFVRVTVRRPAEAAASAAPATAEPAAGAPAATPSAAAGAPGAAAPAPSAPAHD